LDKIDLPTCVASSGSQEKMRFTLGLTGLWDRFAGRIYSADGDGEQLAGEGARTFASMAELPGLLGSSVTG
jgi:hypothetical protein